MKRSNNMVSVDEIDIVVVMIGVDPPTVVTTHG